MNTIKPKSFFGSCHGYTTDPMLLKQLMYADDESWKVFYKKYERLIKSVGHNKGLSHADCDDLMQNVMTVCCKRMESFLYQKEKGHFRSFIVRIAENLSFQLLRKKNMSLADLPEYDDYFDQKLMREYETFILSYLLKALEKKVGAETYAIFEMLTLQEYTVDEICQICKKSHGAIYLLRHRCIKILRSLLHSLPEIFIGKSEIAENSNNKAFPC